MADTQEQSLTATTTLALTDLVRVVTDPGGSPVSKVMTLANFQAAIRSLLGLTDIMIAPYQVRTTATFSKTSDTTLADVPGLSVNLVTGNNYLIEAQIPTTANSAGGTRTGLGGTVTPGVLIIDDLTFGPDTFVHARGTALSTAVGVKTGAANFILMHAFISVTIGGTLTVMFAQSNSNGTASVVQIGASLCVKNIT
jgi:hypothetical protein